MMQAAEKRVHNFPQSQPLVKHCRFGVSPVSFSDSDSDRGLFYEGCPSKSWTFVIKRQFVSGIL